MRMEDVAFDRSILGSDPRGASELRPSHECNLMKRSKT